MKILMLTDKMEAGGAETHLTQLVLGLTRLGVEVTVMSGGGRLADALEKVGIRQLWEPLYTHDPFRLLRIRRRLRRLVQREKFDILHAHARIPALLIRGCEGWGAGEVVTVHARFHSNFLLSRLCNWGRHTVAVSEDLRAYVCDVYGVPAERVRVISNGIDCKRFSPPVLAVGGRAPRILFASRLDADCSLGAELLCEIAPTLCLRYPGVSIGIAGGGSEYLRILRLAEAVNQTLGRDAILCHGWVDDMPSLLREYDIFVGVSRAAMEAGASGCAVILCGNEGYLGILERETVSKAMWSNFCGRGAPVPTKEVLEQDLCTLLESPSRRLQCGEALRTLIASRFDADAMCRETLALYHGAIPIRSRYTVCIGGYFGCGNTGDDAILLGFLSALHELTPEVGVIALTAHPHRDSKRFGVRCANRKNPIAVGLALARSDAFLCGGGSLLQNMTGTRSLSYYLWLIRAAASMKAAPILYAAGIGPLIGEGARGRVARTLARCRYISLRDEDSQRYLMAAGVDAGKLRLGADPALLMPLPPSGRAGAILQGLDLPQGSRFLCVVLRGGAASAMPREILLAAVRLLCQRHALIPLFPIFDECQDRADTQAAARLLNGKAVVLREPADAAAILSASEAVISMRLHALILSAAVGTPAVGLPADVRDNKIAAFARSVGQEYSSAERPTVAELIEKTEAALANFHANRPILADSVSEMRKKAHKDLENITEMIYNNR